MYSTSRLTCGALAVLVAVLTGCSDKVVGSKDVATADMYADMNVWAYNESIIVVTADLKKGESSSDTHVDLEGGDRLVVSLNVPLGAADASGDLFDQVDAATSAHKVMDGGPEVVSGIPPLFSDFWIAAPYRARFDTAKIGDTFIVALERSDFADAPNSSVVLPETFAISAPTSGGAMPRSAGLVINWSPVQASASVVVNAGVACVTGTSGKWSQTLAVDTGTVTIPAGTFTEPAATCDLLIIVDRTLQGSTDPNYGHGGKILAHQSRFVTAKSIP